MCRNRVSNVAGELCNTQIAVMLHCWQTKSYRISYESMVTEFEV